MQKDARHEAIVRKLLDRQEEDRNAREKRLQAYSQYLENAACPASPARLHKFHTTVPCRISPAARRLMDKFRKQYFGSTVTFPHLANGQQAVMLTSGAGAKPMQIGWVEHYVEADPQRCNVCDQGLAIETDGASMLVLQFRYPPTPLKLDAHGQTGSASGAAAGITEIRPALDLRLCDDVAAPPLTWVTRPEVDAIDDVGFRDFEAFYVRFKLEIQAAVWSSLMAQLSGAHDAHWVAGRYYSVVRVPEAAIGRIHQTTVDDRGTAVDIGLDCIYDAPVATDILLLYLESDVLADLADIHFTLLSHRASNAPALREEFFTTIREFWASAASLAYHYGSELATALRLAQRAVPTPPQAVLLRQDWITLRQRMFDRFGEGGRDVAELAGDAMPPSPDADWPFAQVPAGEVNIGLRLLYRAGAAQNGTIAERPLSDIMQSVTPWPAEIQNIVMVAEQLPHPSDIGLEWVMKHDRILANVLLDGSFRDALDSITRAPLAPGSGVSAVEYEGARDWTIEHVDTFSGTAVARADGLVLDGEWKRGYRYQSSELMKLPPSEAEVNAMRERLYEHLKANILHYQQAIWLHEDPQQRTMRYRKSGRKMALDWRFELESAGELTIDELRARFTATHVDGQFAAYSTGRSADLERLIDSTEPLGYYGNYAIYAMRPEFGSEEFFSMLHFFKSPFLQYNPETGEAELDCPKTVAVEVALEAAFVPDVETPEQPSDYQIVAGSTYEIVLSGNDRGEPAACMIVPFDSLDTPALLAGRARHAARVIGDVPADLSVAPVAADGWLADNRVFRDSETYRLLRPCASAEFGGISPTTELIVGMPAIAGSQFAIVARKGRWRKPVLFTGAPAATTDPRTRQMIIARGNEVMTPSLVTG
jgi:hypothetical protein